MAITFLTMLLLQVDKVLLSRLLPLKEFGYYTLAATAAGVLYMVVVPVTQAVYPSLVKYSTIEDQTKLVALYHQTTQLTTVLTAPAVMLLVFFAEGVVYMWSGNTDLAINTAPLLSILALGSFLNCLSYLPYNLQLAHGWTSLLIKTNTAVVFAPHPRCFLDCPALRLHGGRMGMGSAECRLCIYYHPVHASQAHSGRKVELVYFRCAITH